MTLGALLLTAIGHVLDVSWLFWPGFGVVSLLALLALFRTLGRYNKAAVIHDALYEDALSFPQFTRKEADLCFRDAMKELGVSRWKRRAMWLAVRVGGLWSWKKRS